MINVLIWFLSLRASLLRLRYCLSLFSLIRCTRYTVLYIRFILSCTYALYCPIRTLYLVLHLRFILSCTYAISCPVRALYLYFMRRIMCERNVLHWQMRLSQIEIASAGAHCDSSLMLLASVTPSLSVSPLPSLSLSLLVMFLSFYCH